MITCTCGHRVDDFDETVTCSVAGWSRECTPSVDYVTYCRECYDEAVADDRVLHTEADEMAWLTSQWR